MARRSVPGQGRRPVTSKKPLEEYRKGVTFDNSNMPPHEDGYDMQYHASRTTGHMCGGHYWNPPADCIGRIVPYYGERWVNVGLCKACRKHSQCEASRIPKVPYGEWDTPQRRAKLGSKRRSKRRS